MERQDIATVLEFRIYLSTKKKKSFTITELMNYFFRKPFGKSKKSQDEVLNLLKTEVANMAKSLSYIVPKSCPTEGIDFKKTKFVFLEDHIKQCAKKRSVLNTAQLNKYFEHELPVFYNKEYMKHGLLIDPISLVEKINRVIEHSFETIRTQANGPVDIRQAASSLSLSEQFIQLVHLLPFIDPKDIIQERKKGQSFFIRLYNVLRIHATIEFSKANSLSDADISNECSSIYQNYYYNVAGVNLTAYDIKYKLLECVKPYVKSSMPSFFSCFGCGAGKVLSKTRLKMCDYRRRLVCGEVDKESSLDMHAGLTLQYFTPAVDPHQADGLGESNLHCVNKLDLTEFLKCTNFTKISTIGDIGSCYDIADVSTTLNRDKNRKPRVF